VTSSTLFAETNAKGRPRWLRVEQLPFSRAVAYTLINKGVVNSVLMTWPGSKRGTRLIDADSLDRYLEGLMQEQVKVGEKWSNGPVARK
jgi:hypothetical protein